MQVLTSLFTLTFVSGLFISIVTFWGLGYIISFLPKEQVKTDIFWIVLISVALATISMWISIWMSYQEIPIVICQSYKIMATGGFPLTCFSYFPHKSAFPPTLFEINIRFFINYLCFMSLYFFPLFYTAKDYNLATLFTKKQQFIFGTLSLLTNIIGLIYIFIKFN